nr:MAG TPA: hypothetical protein [Caudoviricetes sp.]
MVLKHEKVPLSFCYWRRIDQDEPKVNNIFQLTSINFRVNVRLKYNTSKDICYG